MARYSKSRFLPILLVVVIMIIAIAAIVSMARAIFFSDNNDTAQVEETNQSRQALLNTEANRSVRMTVRGPIVADEEFTSYQITVSPSDRSLVTYRGYLDNRVNSSNLDNNGPAYEQFVHALDKANLAKGVEFGDDRDDVRGICATGVVYEFETYNGDERTQYLWTSTCDGSQGSLDASVDQVKSLFNEQIPTADELVREIDMRIR